MQYGDFDTGIGLYRWNAAVSAAFWPSLGHVEVAVRNAMSDSLAARHERLGRNGSWLDLASAFPAAPDRRRETVEDPAWIARDCRVPLLLRARPRS